MKASRLLSLVAVLSVLLSACSRPALSTPENSSLGTAKARVAETSQATAVVQTGSTERAWYADRLEKLGFFVFPAPVDVGDFGVEALGGGSVTLAQQKGKIVLLNFWATWCPPCRAEMPSIEVLWKKMKGKPFTIMAVSVGEDRPTVAGFITDQKYSYPVYLDPESKLGSAFNASSIPTTYILDKSGKVIAGIQGSREYDGPETLALFGELAAK